jgi:anaerobic ribonucleoside-triphosphate reductase activating protein
MNYATIKQCDIANGPGVRTSLFVSGCRVHCPGCFNSEAWDFAAGQHFDDQVAERIWHSLEPAWVRGLSVLGGEPFEPENQQGLLPFLEETRRRFPAKDVWAFSGYLYDRDLAPADGRRHTEHTERLLACVDVLVDGPFVAAEHDITLRFRGSANQRLIDVAASRAAGEVVWWHDETVYETHTM